MFISTQFGVSVMRCCLLSRHLIGIRVGVRNKTRINWSPAKQQDELATFRLPTLPQFPSFHPAVSI